MQAPRRRRPSCTWRQVRCYVPSLVCAVVTAVLIAYGVWLLRNRDVEAIRTRHLVNGFLLWWVITPVIIGTVRGVRRSARHLTRLR